MTPRTPKADKAGGDPLDFPCQNCGAAPGAPCKTAEGRQALQPCSNRVRRASKVRGMTTKPRKAGAKALNNRERRVFLAAMHWYRHRISAGVIDKHFISGSRLHKLFRACAAARSAGNRKGR